jgi:Domain of unknown function (DUF3846)
MRAAVFRVASEQDPILPTFFVSETSPEDAGESTFRIEVGLDGPVAAPSDATHALQFVNKPPDVDSLDWLQSLVGGWVEPVTLNPAHAEGFINETGKLEGLPPNEPATAFWQQQLGETDFASMANDYIPGNLVVVGPLDLDGETTGISSDFEERLRSFAVEQGLPVVEAAPVDELASGPVEVVSATAPEIDQEQRHREMVSSLVDSDGVGIDADEIDGYVAAAKRDQAALATVEPAQHDLGDDVSL